MELAVYYLLAMLILFLSYRISLAGAFGLSIASSIFILIYQPKAGLYEKCIYLFLINSFPLLTENFKRGFKRHKQSMHARFDQVKNTYEDLADKDKQEIEANLEEERKLQQVLSLYEISKDMTSSLSLEEILNIFSSTLKKSFRFSQCRLIILGESSAIETVYKIEIGASVNKSGINSFDMELANVTSGTRKAISVSPHEDSAFLRRFSIIKNFETLVSMPLFVEEKLSGILYVENIPRIHFENFLILAGQFAIQFQKVLLYMKVQEMSITDSLTGISTRRHFLERFLEELRRSMRHKSNLALLMLDMDHFKEKNDRYGHLVGDVVLREVASLLKSNLREIDIIGRYGGEEFAIVLAGINRDGAFHVAERIRENIQIAIFKAYDETVSTTVSTGVSVFPDDGVDIEGLIESADKALYKAKETGRNRVC